MRTTFAAPRARGPIRHLLVASLLIVPFVAEAQTDYFNTDRGRPLHVQDAIAIERYAFELQAAPLKWQRSAGARGVWSIEPELAYGLLPRTQVEVGLPLYFTVGAGRSRQGVGAVHISLLHALNVETLGLPAFAINAAVAIPAGDFGPRRAYTTLGALVTRTTRLGRLHLNADATQGSSIAANELDSAPGLDELSRWTAGVAVDRAMPLRSLLLGAELVAHRSMLAGSDVEWRAGAGIRWQVNPLWSFDAGLGRSLGDEREWLLTFGAARSFGLLHFMPVSR